MDLLWIPYYSALRMVMPGEVRIQTYTDEFGNTAFRMTHMGYALTTTISKFEMLQLRAEDVPYYVTNIMAEEVRRRWDRDLPDPEPYRQLRLPAPTPLR